MIDIHSHIIHGVDDGARTMGMSLDMAQQAVDAGVTHLVCTPHMQPGTFNNTPKNIERGYKRLVQHVKEAGIPLTLSWAGEVRLSEMVPVWYKQNNLPYLGNYLGKRALLLEMPHSKIPAGTKQLLSWLKSVNVQPIIPHPERNRDVWKCKEKIQWLLNNDCLLQVTAGAFLGRFGKQAKKHAIDMLHHNQIFIIASDTHDTKRRPNDMGEAYEIVTKLCGKQQASELFVSNPRQIIGR